MSESTDAQTPAADPHDAGNTIDGSRPGDGSDRSGAAPEGSARPAEPVSGGSREEQKQAYVPPTGDGTDGDGGAVGGTEGTADGQ